MRRRPGGPIRVTSHCARCGLLSRNYDVRRCGLYLDGRSYDLVVCRQCYGQTPVEPTSMEADAMAIDASDPIASMRFTQRWNTDAARVQRTAEHFLGSAYPSLRRELVAEYAERRERHEEWSQPWRDTEGL